jgi:hypothetical protein
MNQDNDFEKAMREATRGVIEYVQTGRAPLLSICDDGPFIAEQYRRAIEAVAETLLGWGMLSGEEFERVVDRELHL